MSSATETIRSMLNERGVEWEECRVPTLRSELAATFWYDRDGNPCSAVEGADDVPDGMLSVQANLTPEQAIEATLGRGECQEAEAENAKLRELVQDLLHHIEYPPCEGCLLEMSCAGDLSQCDEYFDWLKPRARKLGVEVDA